MARQTPSRRRTGRARWRRRLLVGAAATVGLAVLGYAVVWWVVEPPPPGDFYTAPADLGPRPGALLRTETVSTDVRGADAHRILYSSRDLHDRPTAVSGLVLVPRQPAPAGGFPVVAWAHGTSGVARRCAPSLAPDSTTRNVAGAQALVGAGYLVVATDYPGLGTEGTHPYLIGSGEARAVLDSIRAVQAEGPAWHAGSGVVLWGHSQGGHAALFASQYAPAYAPEVELLGAAVAAPATELAVLLRHDITEPVGKVFGSMAFASWSRLFPGANLADIVRPRDRPLVTAIAEDCIETRDQGLVLLPEVGLMSSNFVAHDPVTTEPWGTIIRDNTVAPEGITVPLFVAQGSADRVIQPKVTRDWARRMCRQDSSVAYREYPGEGHLSVLSAAQADVQDWIGERLAGRPAAAGCDVAG